MPDCFIYDHVRTPRGRGKPDGALHSVTALELASQALRSVRDRNNLDTGAVDDVVFGCVDPVGEAGGDIARAAALNAGFDQRVPGIQVNRFCASGLDAVNFASSEVMSGQHDMAIGGGVESMSRIGLGASGGAWPSDPSLALKSYYLPQGVSADLISTKYGFSRDDVDAYAVESQKRAAASWGAGNFSKSVIAVKDVNGLTVLDTDEHMRPDTTMQSLAALKPAFISFGEQYGFDAVAVQRYPELESITHVHHAGNSSGIVDGAAAVLLGSKGAGRKAGLEPRARIRAYANIGSEPSIMLTGPGRRDAQGLEAGEDAGLRHRPVRDQRGLRLGGAALHAGARARSVEGQRRRRRHRHGPPARRHRRHDPGHRAGRAGAARPLHRPHHPVHRRRHGHRHHHRARVRPCPKSTLPLCR